jgi:hypothetical protein
LRFPSSTVACWAEASEMAKALTATAEMIRLPHVNRMETAPS